MSKSTMKLARHALILLIIALPFQQGCSVKYSFTGASIPPEAKTVSVQLFQNMASIVNPSLSSQLTEDLKNRFVSQTRLSMVSDFGDLAFSGQITQYSFAPMAVQGNEIAAENRFSISVKVKFVNAIDPKLSYDRTFTQYKNYSSSQNFASVESQLVSEILEKLVDDIFNAAVANW